MATFPDEILSMICGELSRARDFNSLFSCALVSRRFAEPALRMLYQHHELSPAFVQSEEDAIQQDKTSFQQKWRQAERSFRKWIVLWRSIVVSSLDTTTSVATYRRYCRYLRTLDLRNFAQMLEDGTFANNIRTDFFNHGLKDFYFSRKEGKEGKRTVIDAIATVNAIGEAVVPRTFQLEEITGNLSPEFLVRWVSHTPRLKTLVLFQGDPLTPDVGEAVSTHCAAFQSITIREWQNPNADDTFAQFLDALRPDCLIYFEMISSNKLQVNSFRALGRHQNLQELKLGGLSADAVRGLAALKHCTSFSTLLLEDNVGVSLQGARTLDDLDVIDEIVTWLKSCNKLQDLTIKKFPDGPEILGQVLGSPNIRLRRLSVEGYIFNNADSTLLYTVLPLQTALESLSFRTSGEDAIPFYIMTMVEELSKVVTLRELILKDVSDEFEEHHIFALLENLTNLEEFWTSGGEISEDVLTLLENMPKLKTLTLLALTKFSVPAVLKFIRKLDLTIQKGFHLSLLAQHSDFALSDEDQELIKAEIEVRLGGRFDYALWRDPDSDESEDSD